MKGCPEVEPEGKPGQISQRVPPPVSPKSRSPDTDGRHNTLAAQTSAQGCPGRVWAQKSYSQTVAEAALFFYHLILSQEAGGVVSSTGAKTGGS